MAVHVWPFARLSYESANDAFPSDSVQLVNGLYQSWNFIFYCFKCSCFKLRHVQCKTKWLTVIVCKNFYQGFAPSALESHHNRWILRCKLRRDARNIWGWFTHVLVLRLMLMCAQHQWPNQRKILSNPIQCKYIYYLSYILREKYRCIHELQQPTQSYIEINKRVFIV